MFEHPNDNDLVGIVYNADWGGFSLSDAAVVLYARFKGIYPDEVDTYDVPRDDPKLVNVVCEMGKEASGSGSCLRIKWVPKGALYRIDEYDGQETVVLAENQKWLRAGDADGKYY